MKGGDLGPKSVNLGSDGGEEAAGPLAGAAGT